MAKENRMTDRITVAAVAVVCCLLWGSAAPFIKIGYRLFGIGGSDISEQILFAGIRFALAGVLTIIFGSAVSKKPLLPSAEHSGRMILCLALFQTVVQYFFFFVGVANTTGFKTSILNGTGTFFSILVACLVFRYEKLTARKITGCILGFVAIVIINLNSAGSAGEFRFIGDGFILLSILSNAFVAAMIKNFSKRENPVTLTGYQFILGGVIMAAGAFIAGARISGGREAWLILVYLSLVSAVAYTLWSVLLKYNPVSSVTVYVPVNPLFGVVLSALLLGEAGSIEWGKCILALVLITSGILIVNAKK